MLEISPQSLAGLENGQDARFPRDLVALLRGEMPGESAPFSDDALEDLVRRTIAICSGWGIEDPESCSQICALALGFGEGMLQQPDVVAYFSDLSIPPEDRVRQFIDALDG